MGARESFSSWTVRHKGRTVRHTNFTMLSCEKLRKLSCSECHVMRGTGKSRHLNFYETLLDSIKFCFCIRIHISMKPTLLSWCHSVPDDSNLQSNISFFCSP